MAKLAKEAVDFEHPAKGEHHCGECEHFAAPHGCEIVAGRIERGDWCNRFRASRRRRLYRHASSQKQRDDG